MFTFEVLVLFCILGPLADVASELASGGRFQITRLMYSTAAHVIFAALGFLSRGCIQRSVANSMSAIFTWLVTVTDPHYSETLSASDTTVLFIRDFTAPPPPPPPPPHANPSDDAGEQKDSKEKETKDKASNDGTKTTEPYFSSKNQWARTMFRIDESGKKWCRQPGCTKSFSKHTSEDTLLQHQVLNRKKVNHLVAQLQQ